MICYVVTYVLSFGLQLSLFGSRNGLNWLHRCVFLWGGSSSRNQRLPFFVVVVYV